MIATDLTYEGVRQFMARALAKRSRPRGAAIVTIAAKAIDGTAWQCVLNRMWDAAVEERRLAGYGKVAWRLAFSEIATPKPGAVTVMIGAVGK
jgi:hypothetical protein